MYLQAFLNNVIYNSNNKYLYTSKIKLKIQNEKRIRCFRLSFLRYKELTTAIKAANNWYLISYQII